MCPSDLLVHVAFTDENLKMNRTESGGEGGGGQKTRDPDGMLADDSP